MASFNNEPIGLQLARVAKIASRAFDATLAESGGSLPMWLILMSLKGRGYGAQRDLAEAIGIESATLTHHLNRMETSGLVTRRRTSDNRRVQRVELTGAGEAMFLSLLQRVIAFDKQLRTGFSGRDLAQLRHLLNRLATNVDGGNPDGGSDCEAADTKGLPV